MSLALRPLATAAVFLLLVAIACVRSPPSNPESGAPGASGANQASQFTAPDTVECVLRIALTALATRVHPIAHVSFEDRTKCDVLPGIPLLRGFAVS